MSDASGNIEGAEVQQPFRHEVDIDSFDTIRTFQHEIRTARELFPSYEDRPLIGLHIVDLLQREEFPNEVRLEAVKQAFSLIEKVKKEQDNIEIARTVITAIHMQKDPEMQIRMAAIVSHDLDDEFFDNPRKRIKRTYTTDDDKSRDDDFYDHPFRDEKKGKVTMDEYEARFARKIAFTKILESGEKGYAHTAKALLEPSPTLRMFNSLYHLNGTIDMTPRIVEEITDEALGGEEDLGDDPMTTAIVRLAYRYLPTPEKMSAYERVFKRPLPVFVGWREGRQLVSIRFNAELTQRARELWTHFQSHEMSRDQVMTEAEKLKKIFFESMNDEQRRDIEEQMKRGNVQVRFSTYRGSADNLDTESELPANLQHTLEPVHE